MLRPEANPSGKKDQHETRQPDPYEFILKHGPAPWSEERLDPHRRNLDRCPGEEISLRGEGG